MEPRGLGLGGGGGNYGVQGASGAGDAVTVGSQTVGRGDRRRGFPGELSGPGGVAAGPVPGRDAQLPRPAVRACGGERRAAATAAGPCPRPARGACGSRTAGPRAAGGPPSSRRKGDVRTRRSRSRRRRFRRAPGSRPARPAEGRACPRDAAGGGVEPRDPVLDRAPVPHRDRGRAGEHGGPWVQAVLLPGPRIRSVPGPAHLSRPSVASMPRTDPSASATTTTEPAIRAGTPCPSSASVRLQRWAPVPGSKPTSRSVAEYAIAGACPRVSPRAATTTAGLAVTPIRWEGLGTARDHRPARSGRPVRQDSPPAPWSTGDRSTPRGGASQLRPHRTMPGRSCPCLPSAPATTARPSPPGPGSGHSPPSSPIDRGRRQVPAGGAGHEQEGCAQRHRAKQGVTCSFRQCGYRSPVRSTDVTDRSRHFWDARTRRGAPTDRAGAPAQSFRQRVPDLLEHRDLGRVARRCRLRHREEPVLEAGVGDDHQEVDDRREDTNETSEL